MGVSLKIGGSSGFDKPPRCLQLISAVMLKIEMNLNVWREVIA
jgi:hypothetical protein